MTSNSENRFPEGVVLTLAALLGAVMVLAGLVLGRQALQGDDVGVETAAEEGPDVDSGVTTTTPTTSPAPSSSTTTEPAEPPTITPLDCPVGVDEVICRAAEFVQIQRERPFQEFPTVEILPDAEFDAALLEDFDSYTADIEAWGVTLKALGLVDPDTDLVDIYRQSLSLGVVGFYDTITGRLVVRGDDFGIYAQLVLVHELTHALDDQWFDLDREQPDGEADYGFSAVIEGNASRVENEWREGLGPDEQSQLLQEETSALSAEDLSALLALPPVILELDYSPYTDGLIYTSTVAAAGGEAAVDEALTDPPTSSEEVLHPSTDRATDPEDVVDIPPADGEVAEEGRLGELLVTQWLGRSAATGWGGDGYASWTDEQGRSCIVADMVADDASELEELRTAAEGWAADGADRTVEDIDLAAGTGIRATGCA